MAANNREVVWDEEFGCPRVDDVLFPQPLNEYHPPAPQQQAGSAAEHRLHEQAPNGGRRRRNLTASISLETKHYSCLLYRCEQSSKHILEMKEVATKTKTYYVLTPHEKDGKKRIEAKETFLGLRILSPLIGEIYPDLLGNKSNLPIEQRLEGKWIIELRERVDSKKHERFYSHEKVDKTFRSMNEVATFIVYNSY